MKTKAIIMAVLAAAVTLGGCCCRPVALRVVPGEVKPPVYAESDVSEPTPLPEAPVLPIVTTPAFEPT